jgi:hypothetical protein
LLAGILFSNEGGDLLKGWPYQEKESIKMLKKFSLSVILVAILISTALNLQVTPVWPFSAENHDAINDKAFENKSLSKDAQEAIKRENNKVDSSEGSSLGIANKNYKPEHHFDRNPSQTNKEAFRKGTEYVRQKKQEAINAIKKCTKEGVEEAIAAMGQALHAIQDFYSHSNYVDLSTANQADLRKAFDDPKQKIPEDLKLTGYDPNASNPYKAFNPKGDDYPHGLYWGRHKDCAPVTGAFGVDLTPGDGGKKITRDEVTKTKFQWAKEAAEKHSGEFIEQIKNAVDALWTQKFGEYKLSMIFTPFDPYTGGILASISPAGGFLDDGAGTKVEVSSGALFVPTYLYSLWLPVSAVPDELRYTSDGGRLVKFREFWPDGLTFNEPVTITIPYSPSEIEPLNESTLRVYEWDLYHDAKWNLIPDSTVDTVNHKVIFQTTHFSLYGIGAPPIPTGYNTTWLIFTAISLMLAGRYLLRRRRKFANS